MSHTHPHPLTHSHHLHYTFNHWRVDWVEWVDYRCVQSSAVLRMVFQYCECRWIACWEFVGTPRPPSQIAKLRTPNNRSYKQISGITGIIKLHCYGRGCDGRVGRGGNGPRNRLVLLFVGARVFIKNKNKKYWVYFAICNKRKKCAIRSNCWKRVLPVQNIWSAISAISAKLSLVQILRNRPNTLAIEEERRGEERWGEREGVPRSTTEVLNKVMHSRSLYW